MHISEECDENGNIFNKNDKRAAWKALFSEVFTERQAPFLSYFP